VQVKIEGIGEGLASAAGVLATRSTCEVGVSGAGGESAWVEDGVGRAGSSSPKCCDIVVFIARTMSWNTHSKSGVILARLLG